VGELDTKRHDYPAQISWTGNRGAGTRSYRGYDRTWNMESVGKPVLACSNDPLLGGDPSRYNPEDLLLSALASCHMLWYLHLASNAGIIVHAYEDQPLAIGETSASGAGRFVSAELRPTIEVEFGADLALADRIHQDVHRYCFIARSVNFPVTYVANYRFRGAAS